MCRGVASLLPVPALQGDMLGHTALPKGLSLPAVEVVVVVDFNYKQAVPSIKAGLPGSLAYSDTNDGGDEE